MLLFVLIYNLAEFVIAAVVIFQFVSRVITGQGNERLVGLGRRLSHYVYQILLFLTYNTDEKPFPFSDWSDHQDT